MKFRFRHLLLALAVLLAFGILLRVQILTALGSYLVQAGPPREADTVLVLAGDAWGNRILKGAELVKQGYAPKALISGPSGMYGFHECDLAIPFAVRAGYPESSFIHFEHDARSTAEEARAAVPQLRALHVTRVLLVTNDYHTHRAGNIFRAVMPDLTFDVVAAPDPNFSAAGWWHNREGRKIFLMEWMKTVAGWFGV